MKKPAFFSANDFGGNPELAVLDILKRALEVTTEVLLSTYPDLEDEEWTPKEADVNEQFAYASGVLSHVQALERAIINYRLSVKRFFIPNYSELDPMEDEAPEIPF